MTAAEGLDGVWDVRPSCTIEGSVGGFRHLGMRGVANGRAGQRQAVQQR